MKEQLFFGKKPEKELLQPVINQELLNKPLGGLWTSTYEKEYGSDWLQWTLGNDFYDDVPKAWLLKPRSDLRVLLIDSYNDLVSKMDKYISRDKRFTFTYSIDFEEISKEYDVIHLTSRGEIETRFTTDYHLYGWDCESCLWLNWGFEEVTEIKEDWKEKQI